MTDGKRLPAADIRRLARMMADYDAGLLARNNTNGSSTARMDGLLPFVLLEKFSRIAGSGDPETIQFGRYFTARASLLTPTRRRVQVLRQQFDWPLDVPFRLRYADVVTDDLYFTNSADDIQAAINDIPDLDGQVVVIGRGSLVGDTQYAGRQYHIRFADSVNGDTLLETEPPAGPARLFADYLWPTASVHRIIYGLPGELDQLSAGACVWAQSLPGLGWVMLVAECFNNGS